MGGVDGTDNFTTHWVVCPLLFLHFNLFILFFFRSTQNKSKLLFGIKSHSDHGGSN